MHPLVVVAGVAALAVGACGAGATQPTVTGAPQRQVSTTIALGLYSEVPDPTWTLTVSESKELYSEIATLAKDTAAAPTGGLGYHGFTIEGPEGTLVAYDGTVSPDPDTRGGRLPDPERVIERLLLRTGQPHLKPGEYTEVRRSLGG
jgi:hypothetical protein